MKEVAEPIAPAPSFQLSDARPPKIFQGENGILLTMVFLQKELEGPDEALIQFTGMHHPLAGMVFRAEGTIEDNSMWWRIKIDGRKKLLVSTKQIRNNSTFVTRIWLNYKNSIQVAFSDPKTEAFDVDKYLGLHERQVKDGSLARLAKIDAAAYRKIRESDAIHAEEALAKACGPIPVEMDWASFSDEDLRSGIPCLKTIEILGDLCNRDARSLKLVKSQTKRVVCEVSNKDDPRWEQDELHIAATYSLDQGVKHHLHASMVKSLGIRNSVVESSDGRIIVFDPENLSLNSNAKKSKMYYGDGRDMYQVVQNGNNISDIYESFFFRRTGSHWVASCNSGDRIFKEVPANRADVILDSARYLGRLWKRSPVVLARDPKGMYYYVDRIAGREGQGYKVFKGPRGQLRETTLVDIVNDSKGKIFSTSQGNLRLLISESDQARWIVGKRDIELTVVWQESRQSDRPGGSTAILIYKELGVYDGKEMGNICD